MAIRSKCVCYCGKCASLKGKGAKLKNSAPLTARLLCLFALGCLLFNYPMLALFNVRASLFGIPVLYMYLFVAWALVIVLMAWLMRKRD